MANQPRLRRDFGGTGHPKCDANVVETTGSLLIDQYLASGRQLDDIAAPPGRTVVVVPHPDDEALATGGIIAHQRARGREVLVLAVTDGEAAYPDWCGVELARVRRREQLHALRRLGVRRHAVHRLGIADGAAARHVDALVTALLAVLSPGDTVVAPAVFDWHPDHEACGRAARSAADLVGCTLIGSLFWAHHHPEHAPAHMSLAVLALDDAEVARRHAAASTHRSQMEPSTHTSAEPILATDLLGLLDLPVEYYVTDPAASGPNAGGGT
jgi:LmbE family N-acetylglucosaminyl deacetylase